MWLFKFGVYLGMFMSGFISYGKSCEIQKQENMDTTTLVRLRETYALEVDENLSSFHMIEKEVFDKSSEGGVITAYFKDDRLIKMSAVFYGETGKFEEDYFFDLDSLVVIKTNYYYYDKPIYIEGFKTETVTRSTYYFFKNRLFLWMKDNKSVGFEEYKKKERLLLDDVEEFKNLLTYRPIRSDVLVDTVQCKYGSRCHSTGFVIKGSRDSLGNVIHVAPPVNENVPFEE